MTLKEVQDLEARCLLSVTPVADESLLTNCETCVTASNTDPSLVQLNTVGMQEIVNGNVVSPSPLIYGPTWMPGSVQVIPTPQTPAEDLYDEGAGAVWGSLSDEGGPIFCDGPTIPPYVPVDGGGILGIDVSGDMPIPDAGNAGADGTMGVGFCGVDDVGQDISGAGGVVWGTIADEGVYGGIDDVADYGAVVGSPADGGIGDYGGVDYVPPDYGGGIDGGIDDVADYGAAVTDGVNGGAVWGVIADEGVYGIVGGIDDVADYGAGVYGGLDDVADYGAAAIGGLDDVADYGAVIGSPADGGIDSGIGVNGIDGDYGAAAYGPGDYGIGADDYGIGAGAYGTNDTGAIGSPAGDYGAVDYGAGDYGIGAGDYGTNDTGTIGAVEGDYGIGAGDLSGEVDGTNTGAAVDGGVDDTISLEILDAEAAELHPGNTPNGATFRITRTSIDEILAPLNIEVKVSGTANGDLTTGGTLSFGADYWIDGVTFSPFGSVSDSLRVVMPQGQSFMDFHVTILNDTEFEDPETILLTLKPSTFGAYKIADETERKITIADQTADLDIESTGVGVLSESAESIPGADLRLNNNDDNHDGKPDLNDDPTTANQFHDPDLKPLTIRRLFPLDGHLLYGSFSLKFNPAIVRVWQNPNKSPLVGGSRESRELISDYTILRESENDFVLWVEGVGEGSTDIRLIHHVSTYESMQFDSLRVTVWNVDLDIDSDNDDGNGPPDRSAWEEELEDHSHAIGKMLHYPDNIDIPVPVLLNLPASNDHYQLRIDFQNSGQSGGVKLKARDGHGQLFSIDAGTAYPLSQFDNTGGQIVLLLFSTSVKTDHSTKVGVQTNGKPDDRIKATITRDGTDLFNDEVKYMVVQPDTFYPHLDHSRFVRDGMASEGVYKVGAAADLPEFALKKLSRTEMELLFKNLALSERSELYDLLLTELPSGYKGVLYRDYVDGEYVLTFAGTDDLQDVVDDAVQSTGLFVTQYQNAMRAAYLMAPLFNGNLRTTGHSLGGGLASAASVVGNIPANTWNAAGLPRATLYKHHSSTGLPLPGTEMYDGSLARYENAAGSLITARYLDWDLLSLVQDYTAIVAPSAIGTRIKMDGPVDGIVADSINSAALGVLMFGLDTNPVASPFDFLKTALGDGFTALLNCHKTQYYHYGFLVREDIFGNVIWDIYGDDFYGNDSHDQ